MRGEDKPYELPPLSSTDDAADGGSPVEVKGRGGTAVLATTPIPPAIPLGPPPAVVSIAQGLAVTASKQQISTPVPPQINLSRLQPEPPQATPTPPSSARSKAAGAAAARGGRKQTAPASVIAVAEAASLAGASTVVVQPQPPPTTHPRPPPVRHG